jgi:hypothetical protein
MTHDANGLAGSPFQHTNIITATYKGATSPPSYFTDNEISQVVTGHFGQSTYVVANGTVVTAYVSNWQSNPSVDIGLSTNHNPVPMQSVGNGEYTYTFEGVIFVVHGSGSGGITLWDNGVQVATAATTWTNP